VSWSRTPTTNWSEIDESLPDREIVIVGPPTTSGTRDAFEELVLEAASENYSEAYGGEAYSDVRTDGAWVDGGENDNLIVQRLTQDTTAFGIFGFSFLEENSDVLIGSTIDGVEAGPEAIASGEYPVARSMFFYIKNQHADEVPAMYEYAEMFMSEQMIGDLGYLKGIGLIPPPSRPAPRPARSRRQPRHARRVRSCTDRGNADDEAGSSRCRPVA
jgi:phosphate transport system substrate-binding protein